MKKNILTFALAAILFSSCTEKKTEIITENPENGVEKLDTLHQNHSTDNHTAQISLDWNGTYEGTLPCADCEGIKTTIVLNSDDTFTYKAEYINKDYTLENDGKIMWHDGTVVHLKGKDINSKFKVIENGLIALDQDGKEIDGPLKEHYNFIKK